jgi:hypothetical protein
MPQRLVYPDANSWGRAVNVAGGSVSAQRLALVDQTMNALKTHNLWPKLADLWVFAGENLPQGLVSWKGRRLALAINSPAFTADREIKGDGVSAYVDTTYTPSGNGPYQLNDCGIGCYVRTGPVAANTGSEIASAKSGAPVAAPYTRIQVRNTGSVYAGGLNGGANASGFTNPGAYTGTYHVNRTNPNSVDLWRNGVKWSAALPQASTAIPNWSFLTLTGRTAVGTPSGFSAAGLSAAWAGASLADAEVTALHNDLIAHLGAIGAYP